jgi:hypothetical protein
MTGDLLPAAEPHPDHRKAGTAGFREAVAGRLARSLS